MRIFVSVGTHPQPFDRLLLELDRIAAKAKHEIFAQTGNCVYEPKNFAWRKFLPLQEYKEKLSEAELLISHGGAGTIISGMLLKKKILVVPRLKRFSEHTNDHQVDIARALAREGKVISIEDIGQLQKAIRQAEKFRPKTASNKDGLVKKITEFIDSC